MVVDFVKIQELFSVIIWLKPLYCQGLSSNSKRGCASHSDDRYDILVLQMLTGLENPAYRFIDYLGRNLDDNNNVSSVMHV